MAVSLAASIFVGFVLESVLYGVFIMIFIAAAITQWERRKSEELRTGNKLVLGFSILLLIFISTHWTLNFWRCFDVFLSGSNMVTIDNAFANQRNGASLARFIVYEAQAWIGDCLLIYRLYHVSGRRWRIVAIPCVMCTALVACGLCLLRATVNLNFLEPESMKPFHAWAVACFSLTFVENLYCLVAISFFIWRTQYDVRHVTTSPLTAVMWIFVESAGMWLLFVALTFLVYLADPTVSVAFVYITNPTLGISFCLMITRLNLHSERRSRASFTYAAKNLDLEAKQPKGTVLSPVSLYGPRSPSISTVSHSNGFGQTNSPLPIPLPVTTKCKWTL